MATPPKNEHPSTYVVQDRQDKDELARLTIQDQLITKSMSGVLCLLHKKIFIDSVNGRIG